MVREQKDKELMHESRVRWREYAILKYSLHQSLSPSTENLERLRYLHEILYGVNIDPLTLYGGIKNGKII